MAGIPGFSQPSCFVVTCSLTALAALPSSCNAAPVPQSIHIIGTNFELREEQRNAETYIAEYLPPGENFDEFTRLFAIWGRLDGSNALSQLQAKIQFVDARKGTDPLANYKAFKADNELSYGLDFLISEGAVIEHNVWCFRNVKGGVIAYQYVRRHYRGTSAGSVKDFISEIGPVGSRVLTFFKANPLPLPDGYGP